MTNNQEIEEENIALNTDEIVNDIDITNYHFMIPTFYEKKADVELEKDFENMKHDLIQESPIIKPKNKSVTLILYASNAYPETKDITLNFYIINHSGKEIESMDFSLKIVIDGKKYPESDVTYKVTSDFLGEFPNETIALMYLTIPKVDTTNLVLQDSPHIDIQRLEGTEYTNLIVRYKK